jgi:uncharacterized protein (TIGR03435 family)
MKSAYTAGKKARDHDQAFSGALPSLEGDGRTFADVVTEPQALGRVRRGMQALIRSRHRSILGLNGASMFERLRFAVLGCSFLCTAFAQTGSAPAFEVASVKRSDAEAGSYCRFLPGGRLSAMSWVKQAIQIAYGVEDYQVTGGPGWLTTDRYDIEAKAGQRDANRNQMLLMLQSLLADRFKLKFHTETRDFDVFDLVVRKSGKLTPLKEGATSRCGRDNSAICGMTTISQLADWLKYSVHRPVLDKTGISGRFDILLDFDTYSIQGQTPPPDFNKPSLPTALQEQLGLRLQPGRAPFLVYIVDSIQRPTEN